jgi:hypothetical protein
LEEKNCKYVLWPFIFSVFSHDTAGLLATSHLFMTYVMNIWWGLHPKGGWMVNLSWLASSGYLWSLSTFISHLPSEWCIDLVMYANLHHPRIHLMGEFFFKKLRCVTQSTAWNLLIYPLQ